MRTAADKLQWLSAIARHPGTTPAHFRIAFELANHLNLKTQQCNPSIMTLKNHSGMSRRTVQRALHELELNGLISVHRISGGDKNLTNSFKFTPATDIKGFTRVTGDTRVISDTRVTGDAPLPVSPVTPRNGKALKALPPYKSPHGEPSRFDDWYFHYPVKKSKAQARKVWEREKLDARADELIEILQNQIENDSQWRAGFGIPHPSTYLNNQRWEDEISHEQPQQRHDNRNYAEKFADNLFGPADQGDLGHPGGSLWGAMDEAVVGCSDDADSTAGMGANIIQLSRN